MSYKYSILFLLILPLLLLLPETSNAQIIKASGITEKASSQLVYFYRDRGGLQVTNTNDTEGVWIHVQFFRSFDPDDNSDTPNVVRCDERDFVDFLTPNDTHIYDLEADNFFKNIGENEVTPGESTSITIENTLGFVVITPIVSESDFTAIAFQNLIGTTLSRQGDGSQRDEYNAMGRDAVDFTTGDVVEDGTPLDGVNNGFVVIQMDELLFNFGVRGPRRVDLVGIVFQDVYGPAGLLGYQVVPGSANWAPFIYDFIENPVSCGNRTVECFLVVGLDDEVDQETDDLNPPGVSEDLLCGGNSTPDYPEGGFSIPTFGWTKIFVSGLDDFENQLGLYISSDPESGRWMMTKTD